MALPQMNEQDFPAGHPGRSDYDPKTASAKEWARVNVHPLGERDFPVGHPGAADTPGNSNRVVWVSGLDPRNPHLEPHTGRTPEQAAAVALLSHDASMRAADSPVVQPLDAMDVAAAMNAKRKAVGHDVLTADEYDEVMRVLHTRPRKEENAAEVRERIAQQHQALSILLGKGIPRDSALNLISLEGAATIIKRFAAAPEEA